MKPNFLIIGAQKCGTTSLYNYLIQHPQILPASEKEVHFFDLKYHQGIDWYLSQFPHQNSEKFITGESSPYYIFHPRVPQRVYQHFPDIKIIILLRDPIARTWSHYHHEVRLGFEQLSFEDAIAKETERLQGETEKLLTNPNYYSFNHQHYTYLSRGRYLEQIKTWMELFPQQQFLTIKSEEFYTNPAPILQQTFKFLGLPPHQLDRYGKYNVGNYPQISPSTHNYLLNYFQPHNRQLEETLGMNLW